MFRKADSEPAQATKKIAPSVISADVNLIGNIVSDGLIDFDGHINGNISCHTLIVRPSAYINGDVKAEVVQISGKINGTIRATTVVLHNTAHVEGAVLHEHITVEEGATIDGKLKKVVIPDPAANDDGTSSEADGLSPENSHRLLEHIRLISSN